MSITANTWTTGQLAELGLSMDGIICSWQAKKGPRRI